MIRTSRLVSAAFGACLTVTAADAGAQVVGVFTWQLQPFCNALTLTVTQAGSTFALAGTDDQCGGVAPRAGTSGTAFLDPDGTVGLGLTTVVGSPARVVHVDAKIDPATLNGPWRDTAGNTGVFTFTPGAPLPGPQRPVPAGLLPGSVTATALANGAVTAAKIAVGAVNDSAQIQAGTLEVSDLNQIGVGSVGVTTALAAKTCTLFESNAFAGAVQPGDLLMATPQTLPAGVYMVPLIAGSAGRFGLMYCNGTAAAIPTTFMTAAMSRVPK